MLFQDLEERVRIVQILHALEHQGLVTARADVSSQNRARNTLHLTELGIVGAAGEVLIHETHLPELPAHVEKLDVPALRQGSTQHRLPCSRRPEKEHCLTTRLFDGF